jgi:uncharacterized protein
MNLPDELERLHHLHQSGALTAEEFAQAKSSLLNGQPARGPQPSPAYAPTGGVPPTPLPLDPARMEQETRQWAMFLHLSLLLGLVVPVLGWVVPILIWQLRKPELPDLDIHGKLALNWMISSLIYAVGSMVVSMTGIGLVIGIPVAIALVIVNVIFPILAGIKANEGQAWKYPLSIEFLK